MKKRNKERGGMLGQGSTRVLGYKESQANNVLSNVSHGDLTIVVIVDERVLLPINSDPSSNVSLAGLFLHVHFSPASATIPDVVANKLFLHERKPTDRSREEIGSCYLFGVCALTLSVIYSGIKGSQILFCNRKGHGVDNSKDIPRQRKNER